MKNREPYGEDQVKMRLERSRCRRRRAWHSHFALVLPLLLSFAPLSLADEINVLSYNIYMRPFFQDGQGIRALYLADQLSSYDAIIFQEVYDDRIRSLLWAGLRMEYPSSTRVLGEDAGIGQDGGIVILSRWPITRERQRIFTAGKPSMNRCPGPDCCEGLDCYADKGVVYARINKAGRCYHLFGTHLQAGRENDALRYAQLRVIEDFIQSQGIPRDEPVIIAGDMNVDRYNETGFAKMRSLLRAKQPRLEPTAPSTPGAIYTFDGPSNDLNENEGIQRYLDYVLYSADHLEPIRAFNQVRIMRAPEPWRQYLWQDWHRDLSDHYAVLGHFTYAKRMYSCLSAQGTR